MKRLTIEIGDDLAALLELAAPGRSRRRSDFIRRAIRKALWELEERKTADAYARQPDTLDAFVDGGVWERPTGAATEDDSCGG